MVFHHSRMVSYLGQTSVVMHIRPSGPHSRHMGQTSSICSSLQHRGNWGLGTCHDFMLYLTTKWSNCRNTIRVGDLCLRYSHSWRRMANRHRMLLNLIYFYG